VATDRILIEIVTAANMSGIKEAQAGFMGMNGPLLAMTAGLGLAVVAGKSAVEIAEKHKKAEDDLAQAIAATGGSLDHAKTFLDDFIGSNRAYISDQAEVIDGYATLARAGLSQTEVQLDMNRAVDLAALKHISLSEAVALVNNAEHGRMRGLIDLGITSKAYVDSQGNVINANKNMGVVMYELDQKIAHGRETTTEMTQATNKLSNDWQDMANQVGPPLIGLFSAVVEKAEWIITKLKELGANKDWNKAISAGLGVIQDWLIKVVQGFRDVMAAVQWIIDRGNDLSNALSSGGGSAGGGSRARGGRAGGGSVDAGGIYTVGESGPETLLMGQSGGYVIPGAGGGGGHTINISIGTYVGDASTLSKMLAHELRLTGAFR
jgi:hypothetical protein